MTEAIHRTLAGLPFRAESPSVFYLAGYDRPIGLVFAGPAFGWFIQLGEELSHRAWPSRDDAAAALAIGIAQAELLAQEQDAKLV